MIRYPFLALLVLIAAAFSWLASFILPAFARMKYGATDNGNGFDMEPRLPWLLSWAQTPDNSLWGDKTFRKENPPSYASMSLWLRRNPSYGFDKWLGGSKFGPYDVHGDVLTSDSRPHEGWRCFKERDSDRFSFLWVLRIRGRLATHFEFGWKYDTGAVVFSPRFVMLKT